MNKSKTRDEPNLDSNGSSPAAAASTDQPPECSATQQVCSRLDPLLIHGLSVERYRAIYNSVLQPSVLTALASSKNTKLKMCTVTDALVPELKSIQDYVCQVLELKQQLWTKLNKPRLHETVREDGRVEVTEIMDLT